MDGKRARRSLWPHAWAALCIAAVCIGFVTRMSYSDDSADAGKMSLLTYAVAPYSVDELERLGIESSDSLVEVLQDDADLIVSGSIGRGREYIHKSILTDFEVDRVIKGEGASLEGSPLIKVFEPVGIYEWTDGKVLMPGDAYLLGGVPMRPGTKYVLFLKRVADSVGINGYVLLSSPYSKMPVSDDVAYRVDESGGYGALLKEYANFDIVVADEGSLKSYKQAQREILDFAERQ